MRVFASCELSLPAVIPQEIRFLMNLQLFDGGNRGRWRQGQQRVGLASSEFHTRGETLTFPARWACISGVVAGPHQ